MDLKEFVDKADIIEQGERFMTLKVNGEFGVPSVAYCGESEIDAMKRFQDFKGEHRQVVKAFVTIIPFLDGIMIKDYDVLEIILDKKI